MVTRSTPYIGTHIGVSVRLVICRTTIGMIDSVAIGVWSAVRQYSAADRIVSFLFTGTPKNLTNYGAATFQTTRAEDFGYVKICWIVEGLGIGCRALQCSSSTMLGRIALLRVV